MQPMNECAATSNLRLTLDNSDQPNGTHRDDSDDDHKQSPYEGNPPLGSKTEGRYRNDPQGLSKSFWRRMAPDASHFLMRKKSPQVAQRGRADRISISRC
jgi:hypothetical protein